MTNPSLLPPNATAAEKAIEAAAADRLGLPVPLRDLWNPDTCPAEFLAWLAWSLSIDAWSPTWPEAVKRSVVKNAIAIQRRKGTASSWGVARRAGDRAIADIVILMGWLLKAGPFLVPHLHGGGYGKSGKEVLLKGSDIGRIQHYLDRDALHNLGEVTRGIIRR